MILKQSYYILWTTIHYKLSNNNIINLTLLIYESFTAIDSKMEIKESNKSYLYKIVKYTKYTYRNKKYIRKTSVKHAIIKLQLKFAELQIKTRRDIVDLIFNIFQKNIKKSQINKFSI